MGRAGFTLIELLVAVAVIALLASMLMGTVGMVRSQARRLACASSERQVGLAFQSYAVDNEGYLASISFIPAAGYGHDHRWSELIAPYVQAQLTGGADPVVDLAARTVLAGCSEWKSTQVWVLGFGMNFYPDSPARPTASSRLDLRGPPPYYNVEFLYSRLSYPSSRLLITDTTDYHTENTVSLTRHRGRFNVLFCDGHVQPLSGAAQRDQVLYRPDLGLP